MRNKQKENQANRKRYAEDPEYRKRRVEISRKHRRKNRDAINERRRLRYATDSEYREKELKRTRKKDKARAKR